MYKHTGRIVQEMLGWQFALNLGYFYGLKKFSNDNLKIQLFPYIRLQFFFQNLNIVNMVKVIQF